VLSGCSLPGLSSSSSDGIAITSMTTTESQIVSHMSRLMIEHYSDGEIEPTMINNLGSSTIQHNALLSGDAQVSGVRYTGTELTGVLDKDPESDPDIALEQTQKAFRSEEHTSELQSRFDLVCRLLLEKKNKSDTQSALGNI